MYKSLLETSKPLLGRKRELATAGLGLIVMTGSFGAGLGMLFPIFNFLLKEKRTLGEIVENAFNGPLEGFGDWLKALMPGDDFYGFMLVMCVVLVLTITGGVGRFLHTYMIVRATSRVVQGWRTLLYRKLIRMDMETYWLHGMADSASRMMSDVEVLRSGYHGVLVRSAQAGLKVITALGFAFVVNWKLTLIALVGGPFIAVVVRKFGKSLRKAAKRFYEANAEMFSRVTESLSDLRVIKMSQSEASETRRFKRALQNGFHQHVRQARIRALSSLVVEVIAMIGVLIVAGLSAWAIFRNDVPASEFMIILGALAAAGASFKPLSNLHHDLTAADAAAQRILEMRDRIKPDSDRRAGELPRLPRHQQSVRFEKLTYTYPGAKQPAIDGIDLEIGFGEMVAIVGGNGSGKTTLILALARLIKPQAGRVLIDGHDINERDLNSVRDQMAMVSQKTRLYEGTIAQNIAYGRSWSRKEDIEAAAQLATADLFINEMPDGYDTPISEGGEGVSGGQAQRLCIARAVLRQPAILMLDEATSQVDTHSESLIARAMHRIAEGRTTIAIAHRLSTIVHADRIIVMEAGRIIAQGKHDELLETCPAYQSLANGQLTSTAP